MHLLVSLLFLRYAIFPGDMHFQGSTLSLTLCSANLSSAIFFQTLKVTSGGTLNYAAQGIAVLPLLYLISLGMSTQKHFQHTVQWGGRTQCVTWSIHDG